MGLLIPLHPIDGDISLLLVPAGSFQRGLYENQHSFDLLKLKGSWGKAGNDAQIAGTGLYIYIINRTSLLF